MNKTMIGVLLLNCVVGMLMVPHCGRKTKRVELRDDFQKSVAKEMLNQFGREHRQRIDTGVLQVAQMWRPEDGTPEEMRQFCLTHFIADPQSLEESFNRLESSFEQIHGVLLELRRHLEWNIQVETGPNLPVDFLLANFNLAAHVQEDLYKSKIAFFVLLNFRIPTLAELLENGHSMSRRQWAEARLARTFTSRVPADVAQRLHEAYNTADNYISNYNFYMHNLLTEDGRRLFPEGMRLISHWGLRDELKARYRETDGLEAQRMIYELMLKIINQEVPAAVINNPGVEWKPFSNQVITTNVSAEPEPDTRYAQWLATFKAELAADPYYPWCPTKIARRFDLDREIPEAAVEKFFTTLLTSKEFTRTADLIRKRLGRDLEPFDIWYKDLKPQGAFTQSDLDQIVRVKFPTANAFDNQIPDILIKLGFDRQTAAFLGSKINVDPARGVGHAQGAARRSDNAHLRTRVPDGGMDYKGYNIAVHELGHNVEQVLSLNRVDHTLLNGVPSTGFTEAFAFVFQSRDLEILGLTQKNPQARHWEALHELWSVCEIASVSLVDMQAWRWLYANPEATPAEFKAAVQQIARDIWNRYFEPVIGHRDTPILAIYSHMIDGGMYLPDYPIGHIIQFQIEEYIRDKNLGQEMERMCIAGAITPKAWMKNAVGDEISVEPLLKAAARALKVLN